MPGDRLGEQPAEPTPAIPASIGRQRVVIDLNPAATQLFAEMSHRRKEADEAVLVTPNVSRLLVVLRHPSDIHRRIKIVPRR
jgi:hypothetical protein